MANARSVPRSRATKPPKVGSPAELASPPSAIVKAMPAGASNRTAEPSAMFASEVPSATRIFPVPWFGPRGGNRYTVSGATTEATVAPSNPAIHQPRNARLVDDLVLFTFVLIAPTTTRRITGGLSVTTVVVGMRARSANCSGRDQGSRLNFRAAGDRDDVRRPRGRPLGCAARARPGMASDPSPLKQDQTTSSSICPSRTRDWMRGRSGGAAFNR